MEIMIRKQDLEATRCIQLKLRSIVRWIHNLLLLKLTSKGVVVDTFNDPLLALSDYKVGTYGLLLLT
jgi:hypothetical protein